MKTYFKPEIEITSISNEDVITTSGGINLAGNSNFVKADEGLGYNVVDNF